MVWAGDWGSDPGDSRILSLAHREQRVLVALDEDSGEPAIVGGQPRSGIVRLAGFAACRQRDVICGRLRRYGAVLREGATVTAGTERVRIRPSGD